MGWSHDLSMAALLVVRHLRRNVTIAYRCTVCAQDIGFDDHVTSDGFSARSTIGLYPHGCHIGPSFLVNYIQAPLR